MGVTSNLTKRVYEHKNGKVEGFAIEGKEEKKWNRAWKLRLIEEHNPGWADLYDGLTM